MIRSTRRRLQLSSETLRTLGAPALRGVLGGIAPSFGPATPSCATTQCLDETDDCQTTTMVPTIVP